MDGQLPPTEPDEDKDQGLENDVPPHVKTKVSQDQPKGKDEPSREVDAHRPGKPQTADPRALEKTLYEQCQGNAYQHCPQDAGVK